MSNRATGGGAIPRIEVDVAGILGSAGMPVEPERPKNTVTVEEAAKAWGLGRRRTQSKLSAAVKEGRMRLHIAPGRNAGGKLYQRMYYYQAVGK